MSGRSGKTELFSGILMPAVSSPSPLAALTSRPARSRPPTQSFSFLLGSAPHTTVDAGASIDLAGFSTNISDALGGGAVIDSGGDVTSNFANNATLNVPSSSVQFSGGFANKGLIHGPRNPKRRRHHHQPQSPPTSTATPCPTSCGRTLAAKPRSSEMNGTNPIARGSQLVGPTLGLSEEGISERRGGGRCEAVPA
jgi:hypothetical protein